MKKADGVLCLRGKTPSDGVCAYRATCVPVDDVPATDGVSPPRQAGAAKFFL
jgi:hypothetical protein